MDSRGACLLCREAIGMHRIRWSRPEQWVAGTAGTGMRHVDMAATTVAAVDEVERPGRRLAEVELLLAQHLRIHAECCQVDPGLRKRRQRMGIPVGCLATRQRADCRRRIEL